MNQKKTGWIFLTIIIIYVGGSYLVGRLTQGNPLDFRLLLFLGEMFMWAPALALLGLNKINPVRFCGFKKVHISTALMTVLFSFMVMPAATFVNILSMFFVENAVNQMSAQVLESGFFISFLAIAVYGPVAEEFVFRGILFKGYKETASSLKAILLSALLFGLMHMNFNQMGYAFVLGIALALLMEATGSILPAMICHITINARSVILMFLADGMQKWASGFLQDMGGVGEELLQSANMEVTKSQLGGMLCLEALFLVACLPIAGCILVWLSKREGRLSILQGLWADRKRGKVLGIPVILGMIICIAVMVIDLL